MSSMVQTIQQKTLPISSSSSSSTDDHDKLPTLRRRLSSLSLNLHAGSISSTSAATWAVNRSKYITSMGKSAGSSVKNWWAWGWAWVMSRKPNMFHDLEMNKEEKHFVGYHFKGSLRHVFYKLKCGVKRVFRYEDDLSLPRTFRC
ncbi:hypothetical protein vseg_006959 [Gypsophila vaccaria]